MKNGGIVFFCITISLLLFSIGFSVRYYAQMCDQANIKVWESRLENRICEGKLKQCQEYNLFQQATSEVSKRPWSEDYDCYEHAKSLQEALRGAGMESSILINEGRTHAWNCVWIEAITGQFIDPENDYEIMEIR